VGAPTDTTRMGGCLSVSRCLFNFATSAMEVGQPGSTRHWPATLQCPAVTRAQQSSSWLVAILVDILVTTFAKDVFCLYVPEHCMTVLRFQFLCAEQIRTVVHVTRWST